MSNDELNINIEPEDKKEFRVPEDSQSNGKKLFLLFIITFVVVVIFASIFFKGLFSNVDVNIGENPVASMDQRGDEDNDLNIRAQIDQRLKMIQNEEEMPGVADRGYETDEELIERLRRDETKKDEKNDISLKEKDEPQTQHIQQEKPTIETVTLPTETPKPDTNVISKIYIGQFSDMQKAVEMQANLINSGLGINPVIREVNGYYTIQAGAFSNYDSAKNLSDQINNAGFSAKVVRELK